MARFETGHLYEGYAREYDPIRILRRTEKTMWVTNGRNSWKMRIRTDENGNEYAVDSSVPREWRDAFTYDAEWKKEVTE